VLEQLAQRLENLCAGADARQFAKQNSGAIAAFIDDTTDGVAFHSLELPTVIPDPALQLRFAAEILRTRLAEPPVPERFLAHVRAFQSGLGCDPANATPLADAQIIHQFQGAYRHYVRPLLDRHPQLIDNFLANHIFKYSYPFGRSQNGMVPAPPTEQHLTLVAHIALTQTMLVGIPASVAHLTQLMHDLDLNTPAAQAQLLQLA
jgi:hypothetical protein